MDNKYKLTVHHTASSCAPVTLRMCDNHAGYCLGGWGQISYRFIIMDNKYELTVHLIAKRNILCPCHFTDV